MFRERGTHPIIHAKSEFTRHNGAEDSLGSGNRGEVPQVQLLRRAALASRRARAVPAAARRRRPPSRSHARPPLLTIGWWRGRGIDRPALLSGRGGGGTLDRGARSAEAISGPAAADVCRSRTKKLWWDSALRVETISAAD